MSRTEPLEVCALCETFHPTSELENVPFLDANRNVVTLRICRRCREQRLTYIQAAWANWVRPDVPRIVALSLLLSFAGLALFFAQALDVMARVILTVAAITTAALGTVVLAWKSSVV
jgi:small-conductance mechanosensitive channel